MRSWLRQHRQAFALALRRMGVLNALVIGIALALAAGGYALLESLRGVAGRVTLEPQLTVFLPAEATRAQAEIIGGKLRADRRVVQLRFLPREEALKELSAVQGMPELVRALGRNPLPDAWVISARAGMLDDLAKDLRQMAGVAHVQADAQWARRLQALAGLGRVGLWLLAAILGAGLIAVTFNTVRLQILTQRDEIEVARLIGATDAFIRRPFYYAGLLQGLAGGVIALLIVAVSLALLNREVAPLAASYGSAFRFAYPAPGDAAAIALFAAALGWLGAHLSVSRLLREVH